MMPYNSEFPPELLPGMFRAMRLAPREPASQGTRALLGFSDDEDD